MRFKLDFLKIITTDRPVSSFFTCSSLATGFFLEEIELEEEKML